jgi:siroheme synthase-like protein
LAYYPICVDLKGKKCLVVGGGTIARRKAGALLRAGARVIMVSPDAENKATAAAGADRLQVLRASYGQNHMAGVFLAVAATDDRKLNALVSRHARKKRVLVNVVDDPDLSTFIVPAVLHRGPLSVAVSTGGRSPLFARKLKERCGRCLSSRHGGFVAMLGRFREDIKKRYPSSAERRAVHRRIHDSRALALFLDNKTGEAERLLRDIVRGRKNP